MFPGLNPKKMSAIMKQMGMSQIEIDAKRVVIEGQNKKIIIENPSVTKIKMQGQTNFQISGDISEEEYKTEQDTLEEDIQIIIEKTECSKEEAEIELKKNKGNLTETILNLTK